MTQRVSRPSIDAYFLALARVIATRATCLHRQQGAVLVKDNHIIAAGYNGAPPGQPHCIDVGTCAKELNYDCRAWGLHGESNAILMAAKLGISTDGATLYSVYSPCKTCCNMLKVAGVVEAIYTEVYSGFIDGPEYLRELGIKCQKIEE